MTSFEFWACQVPPWMFLCTDCFEAKDKTEAWVDDKGQRWDQCLDCAKTCLDCETKAKGETDG